MYIIFPLIFLMLSLPSFEQTTFDYQKDFKTILSKTKDSASVLAYNKILSRFQANDTSLSKFETLALLIGFTNQPDYKPYEDLDNENGIFLLNDNGNYEDALNDANIYLSTHPLSLRVLKEKSYSLHQLKKGDSALYYMDLVHRIMLAMKFSGNGKTPDSPIFALGLTDGERFIENLGKTTGNKGTGKNNSGNYLELVDAISDEGDHQNMYFIIQHASNNLIGPEKPEHKTKKRKKKDKKPILQNTETPALRNNISPMDIEPYRIERSFLFREAQHKRNTCIYVRLLK